MAYINIFILSFKEAYEAQLSNPNIFEHVVSINEESKDYSYRIYGTKSTLLMNFDDLWEKDGKVVTWGHNLNANQEHYRTKLPNETILDDLHKYLDTIDKNIDTNILFHCYAGISRSTAIAIASLIYFGMEIEEAYKFVITLRSIAMPNKHVIKHIDKKHNLNNKLINIIDKLEY
jgi:predicted protein tyrosine phosphatase